MNREAKSKFLDVKIERARNEASLTESLKARRQQLAVPPRSIPSSNWKRHVGTQPCEVDYCQAWTLCLAHHELATPHPTRLNATETATQTHLNCNKPNRQDQHNWLNKIKQKCLLLSRERSFRKVEQSNDGDQSFSSLGTIVEHAWCAKRRKQKESTVPGSQITRCRECPLVGSHNVVRKKEIACECGNCSTEARGQKYWRATTCTAFCKSSHMNDQGQKPTTMERISKELHSWYLVYKKSTWQASSHLPNA